MTADALPTPSARLPRALRPLGYRSYRRVWIGAFVSNIGTWVETIAVGIYVTELTGKSSWTGIVAAAGFLPGAFLSPLGGALADRIPRKALLIATTLIEALCAAALAVLIVVGAATPIAVTLIVFANGCVATISWPTYSAILPELVAPEDLPGAIGLSSAQWNLGRIFGPIVAGVVIAFGGYSWAFAINAISFFAVIIAFIPIRLPRPAAPEHAFFRSIRAGVGFVRRDRGLRESIMLLALNSLLAAPFIALVPAVALKVFNNESPGTSILVTAQGIGAVAMALSIGVLTHRFGIRRFLRGVLFLMPLGLVAYALSPVLAVATIAIAIVGFLYLGALSGFTTVAQTRTPAALRGRVVSLSVSVLALLYPLGSVVQGWLGDQIGLRRTTLVAAAAMVVGLAIVMVFQRGFAPGLDDPAVAGAPGVAPSAEPPESAIEMIPD